MKNLPKGLKIFLAAVICVVVVVVVLVAIKQFPKLVSLFQTTTATSTPTATRVIATNTPMPTATLTATPTATRVIATNTPMPTATATLSLVNWELPEPPEVGQLPTELSGSIKYVEPLVDCATENDPNVSCSTIKGQLTDGDFVLTAGETIVMTGDVIDISKDGEVLVDRPSLANHDLWSITNATSEDITLHMLAPHGSFRGYFQLGSGDWNIQKITHLRDLHLYLFLLPTQTYDRFTPTPVPNCESKYGCEEVNVRVIVFDDAGMHVAGYGLYKENQPFWQDLLQLLDQ